MCWHADTLPFILQVDLGPLFGMVGVPDVVACGLLAFCLQLILLFQARAWGSASVTLPNMVSLRLVDGVSAALLLLLGVCS